jgi:hypothetical protein
MKSQAALSANVLDFAYGVTPGASVFVQLVSSNGAVCGSWAVTDRRERRGEHHPLDAGVARGA